jgi:broad specificity phosphatase PhoE
MKIFLIRHGEAAQSWDQSPDPGLSELGKEQAFECFNTLNGNEDLNQFNLVSSPLKRAQETSLQFKKKFNKQLSLNEAFKEIPSPGISLLERKNWLQEVFKKNISELEKPQQIWQAKILSALKSLTKPTIIFSHFMVINTVVSTLKNDPRVVSFYPDNCSITELESNKGKLNLISTGNELQTHVN